MPYRLWRTCPITRFVLSPSVDTTAASASSAPARASTVASRPWPRTNPPRQPAPRRSNASSLSSTAVTSQPSPTSPFATAAPVLPQPMTRAFTARSVAPFRRVALRAGRGRVRGNGSGAAPDLDALQAQRPLLDEVPAEHRERHRQRERRREVHREAANADLRQRL